MNNQQVNALLSALVFLTGAVLLSVEGWSSYQSLGELMMGVSGLALLATWIRMNRADGEGPTP